jgi:hypothetical protein
MVWVFWGDFDIDEVFDTMEPEEIVNIICEGYGFTHLYKDKDGNKKCGFRDLEDVVWVPYEEITDTTYKKFIRE